MGPVGMKGIFMAFYSFKKGDSSLHNNPKFDLFCPFFSIIVSDVLHVKENVLIINVLFGEICST